MKITIHSLAAILIFISSCIFSQKTNQTYTDQRGRKQLVGKSDRSALMKVPYQNWYQPRYEGYSVDTVVLEKCRRGLEGVTVEVFMGTWCGDSQRHIPKFYKIVDYLGIGESDIQLTNVYDFGQENKYKQSLHGEEKGKLIHRVPTFIFYKKGKEIGRIIQDPVASLEEDMFKIVNELNPQQNFKIVTQLAEMLEKAIPSNNEEFVKLSKELEGLTEDSSELNIYAYVLMSSGAMEKAISVFKINTFLFPEEPNVWASSGEAYEKNRNSKNALKAYQKVLELEPENENAQERIQALKLEIQ